MIMTNNPMRSVVHNEHTEEPKHEEMVVNKEVETMHISAESMTEIAKMVSSMIETSPSYSEKHLHQMYHELDKRIAVVEALIHNMK